jgi:hypothetical protein
MIVLFLQRDEVDLRHNGLTVLREIPCRLHHPCHPVLVNVIIKPPQIAATNDHLHWFHADKFQSDALSREATVAVQMDVLEAMNFTLGIADLACATYCRSSSDGNPLSSSACGNSEVAARIT